MNIKLHTPGILISMKRLPVLTLYKREKLLPLWSTKTHTFRSYRGHYAD